MANQFGMLPMGPLLQTPAARDYASVASVFRRDERVDVLRRGDALELVFAAVDEVHVVALSSSRELELDGLDTRISSGPLSPHTRAARLTAGP